MAKARSGGRRSRLGPRTPLPAWARDDTSLDELDCEPVEVRRVQPYQATKAYSCPGCHATIAAGTGHLVAVPVSAPEDRRHWHRSCWSQRHRRGPRGARP